MLKPGGEAGVISDHGVLRQRSESPEQLRLPSPALDHLGLALELLADGDHVGGRGRRDRRDEDARTRVAPSGFRPPTGSRPRLVVIDERQGSPPEPTQLGVTACAIALSAAAQTWSYDRPRTVSDRPVVVFGSPAGRPGSAVPGVRLSMVVVAQAARESTARAKRRRRITGRPFPSLRALTSRPPVRRSRIASPLRSCRAVQAADGSGRWNYFALSMSGSFRNLPERFGRRRDLPPRASERWAARMIPPARARAQRRSGRGAPSRRMWRGRGSTRRPPREIRRRRTMAGLVLTAAEPPRPRPRPLTLDSAAVRLYQRGGCGEAARPPRVRA